MPLGEYRALDLTDDKGFLCGKMLADLGMDVIKVERPGGDPSRNIWPFYKNVADPQNSLWWFAYNTSKRGITLDIETEEGRNIFLELVKNADFVIESFAPGHMDRLGCGYDELSKVNPRLILASVSGFGQTGPFAQYKAPDIVCMAMSGYMNLIGNPSKPPVRITIPQAYLHAASEAAVGCLIALWYREMTGEGQHVDASAQQAVAWDEFHNQNYWDMKKINLKRMGGERKYDKVTYRFVYECKDGYVILAFFGGPMAAKRQRELVSIMDKEGMADDFLRGFDWDNWTPLTLTSEKSQALEKRFSLFFKTKTNRQLFDMALEVGLFVAPMNSLSDIAKDPHLKERGFWQEVRHPELGETILYPGAPYRSSASPYQITRRAPLIGEHNDEVFREELGFSNERIASLRKRRVI